MDPMNALLVRAVMEARLAAAEDRRAGRRLEAERRAARRRRRREAVAQWWGQRRERTHGTALTLAPATPRRPPTVVLAEVLEEAAQRIARRGTAAERGLLEAMSLVAAATAPGSAAALVEPGGSEAARLRAFGVVHGHLLRDLGPREHASLLALLASLRVDGVGDIGGVGEDDGVGQVA